jgi:hypothetical protein
MALEFTVPADFDGAVRTLERLTGATAQPLVGRDSLDEPVPTAGKSVAVPQELADALLAQAQPAFRARGFLLLRHERNYGVRNALDQVALLPTRDQFEALTLMGTNGANYDRSTADIVAWLRDLERDQPFVLTGAGFDFVEGRFTGAVRDPDALARRVYNFCPDVVDQGTGTVAALSAELRRERTLYCWWD